MNQLEREAEVLQKIKRAGGSLSLSDARILLGRLDRLGRVIDSLSNRLVRHSMPTLRCHECSYSSDAQERVIWHCQLAKHPLIEVALEGVDGFDHILSEPEQVSHPNGRDAMWRVNCSCGYATGPYATATAALGLAEGHQRDKAGRFDG